MERRTALKNIAIAFGCVVATPTLINILTSCINQKITNKYLFLSDHEAEMVQRLVESILPKNHFPLIENINLTSFLDQLFYHTENKESKENFKEGCYQFESIFSLNNNKKLNTISDKDFITVFKKYFNTEKEAAVFNLIEDNKNAFNTNKKIEFTIYTFLTKVRYYCLLGYCTSEEFTKETDYYIP